MKNTKTITVLVATVTLISLSALSAELEPLTVSPGATERFTGVEVRCPTFSWQAVPGTVGYEVVVYQLPLQTELAAWSLDQAVEVLFVELPVGVTAWTPSLERGLARGAEHVWFVRGVMGEDEATQWSKARFFRVAGGFSSGTGTGTGTDTVTATATATATATVTATVTDPAIATATATGPSAMADSVGETKTRDVSTAMAAIRGEMPDVTGETYGVVGTSNSLEGGGLAGVNTTEGPDLVLDGAANGRTDAYLFDWGLDRSSPGVEVFGFTNEEGGTIDLYVGGDDLGICNLTGHPTVVVPTVMVGDGAVRQPACGTLTGRLHDEATLLAVARRVESEVNILTQAVPQTVRVDSPRP